MSYAQIQAQLHEMSGSIGGLKATIEMMTSVWKQQEEAAVRGRRLLHDKVDTLKTDVHGLTTEVNEMKKDVTDLKPAVKRFETEELRADGAKRLGVYLWGAFLTGAGFIGYWIHELMPVFLHRPPPTP